MAADSIHRCSSPDISSVDLSGGYEIDLGDHLSIDVETLFGILEENSDPGEGKPADSLLDDVSQPCEAVAVPVIADKSQFSNGTQVTGRVASSEVNKDLSELKPTKTRQELSSDSFGCRIKAEPFQESCSASFTEWIPQLQEGALMDGTRTCHSEKPSCSTSADSNDADSSCYIPLRYDADIRFSSRTCCRDDSSSLNSRKESSNVTSEYYSNTFENKPATTGAPEIASPLDFIPIASTAHRLDAHYPLKLHCSNMESDFLFPDVSPFHMGYNDNLQFLSNDVNCIGDGTLGFPAYGKFSSIEMATKSQAKNELVPNVLWDCYLENGQNFDTEYRILFPDESKKVIPGSLPCMPAQVPCSTLAKGDMLDIASLRGASFFDEIYDTSANESMVEGQMMSMNSSDQPPDTGSCSSKTSYDVFAHGKLDQQLQLKDGANSNFYQVSPALMQECRTIIDIDPDIYIVEDGNFPSKQNEFAAATSFASQQYVSSGNFNLHGSGHMTRMKSNNEQVIFQAALQDLSQPKSEAAPPAGSLAISLLRHQRIALSWMVQKETASLHCSGGILADDQGLGKTVSTIALILKERPGLQRNFKSCKPEIFNLDDDSTVDAASGHKKLKSEPGDSQALSNEDVKDTHLEQQKGRPSAGTLIVCPTSVLRQWAEELRDKVTDSANLSVLIYHGPNRIKDPKELAKYDVVLTTYSIVTMEVPKQPLNEEEDCKGGDFEADAGFSSGRKRKCAPSDKSSSSGKKGSQNGLYESLTRPLAKVGWFRVVLDEAQSIKNYKTQVARACWGLRAKRRWCLSGTPIQNAIDDLYSYFRFLRYDPYATYNNFRSTIKNPISRNPANGYKKLQAILKPIMLRRTKGTHLDGEPIISLPQKKVELRRVDFTKEEREFYTKLENESRNQFQEYAKAGTVKQNYVNILLMLLRLRQACDHPLLVKGFDSNSMWKPSLQMAKELPREKQISLMNCLEASLAICVICNDAPEDAVVSVCGHVFCKQCVCEHLAGYCTECPAANCKAQFGFRSLFSRSTLNSSLADTPCQETLSVNSPSSGIINAFEPGQDLSYDSSKIKAALEVLQSLPKIQMVKCDSRQDCDDKNSVHVECSPASASGTENSLDKSPETTIMTVNSEASALVNGTSEKAIVFSQWTKMLDLLEACLKNSSIQFRRLDGTMSVYARDKAVKDFNTLPEVSVMMMSLKAASLGLNMVAACHVLLLDLWWNPTTEDQAIDRAHRIGQTRPVTVVRLTIKDTVEDRILALQQKKREMVASAFGEDETGSRQSRLTVDDLNYLFMMD